ncbi:MAG: A/G-specific adenine glycosylase, partial [Candidatus Latescibacterota bacterium]
MPNTLSKTPPKNIGKRLLIWYDANKRDMPWRHTKDPYRILLSEFMLQQTQVDTVIPYYHRFLEAFPTVHHLAKAPQDKILKAWEGLG